LICLGDKTVKKMQSKNIDKVSQYTFVATCKNAGWVRLLSSNQQRKLNKNAEKAAQRLNKKRAYTYLCTNKQ